MVPVPRSRAEIIATSVYLVLVLGTTFVGAVMAPGTDKEPMLDAGNLREINEVERKSHLDAKRQYEEMAERQKKRCDEKLAKWDKEREALQEQLDACPCCPGGCEKELIYKDYLFQSQATYYRMILKKHCGMRRPPDPDEKEIKSFAEKIEEEDEEVF